MDKNKVLLQFFPTFNYLQSKKENNNKWNENYDENYKIN